MSSLVTLFSILSFFVLLNNTSPKLKVLSSSLLMKFLMDMRFFIVTELQYNQTLFTPKGGLIKMNNLFNITNVSLEPIS
jgi:hypothetical protein